MTLVPFQKADDVGDRFLALLHRHQIEPAIGSAIEDELLSLTHLLEVVKNPELAVGEERLKVLRDAAGMHDLAAKVLSTESLPEFPKCLDHLRLIAKPDPAASIGQLGPGSVLDDTVRKMTELYIGCFAAHCGEDLLLDSPNAAKGDNPDVMFRYREKLWALAIKTISSRAGQTIFERISDGARQIDRKACPADIGMVVINAKNAIDHEALWEREYADLDTAIAATDSELDVLMEAANQDRPQDEWDDLFVGRVVRPILLMGQSMAMNMPNDIAKALLALHYKRLPMLRAMWALTSRKKAKRPEVFRLSLPRLPKLEVVRR